MNFRTFGTGAGIPPGWNLDGALAAQSEAAAVHNFNNQPPGGDEPFFDPLVFNNQDDEAVDLLVTPSGIDLLADDIWPVRNQGARSTCNAFAVVAAEELIRFRANPGAGIQNLSEEHFYAATKHFGLREFNLGLTPDQQDELNATGTTYLAQAKRALADFGLCKESLLEYRPKEDPNHVSAIPGPAAQDAMGRRVPDMVHNIIEPGILPPEKTSWVDEHQNQEALISTLFIEKLRAGIPIVASFAILDTDSWFGSNARFWGEVAYSQNLDEDAGGATGGHTVCITGYIPPLGPGDPSNGWFVFRNSWGGRFSRYVETDPMSPEAPATGYGYVSVVDTDVYCWEYLCRANPIFPVV